MSASPPQTDHGSIQTHRSRATPDAGLPPLGTRAFICGLAGSVISDFERGYLGEMKPWGVILFARNVETPRQVRRLTDDIRTMLGWQAPVLIDQEGGTGAAAETAPLAALSGRRSLRCHGDPATGQWR